MSEENTGGILGTAFGSLEGWFASVDPTGIAAWVGFVLLVFVFRKMIAGLLVNAVQALLKRFSSGLSEDVVSQLKSDVEIFAITFALYVGLQVLNLPTVADNFLRQIFSSIAVIVVFGTWYQLSGPFSSLLRYEHAGPLQIETDWIQRATQFAVVLFGVTSLLKVWQVDISGALTGVGVFGAGMAIATQDLLRNLIAGMTNISENRFETGDAVRIDGQFMGTVQKIDLRSTLVVGFDQIPRHIPNSDLSNSVVMNYSRMKHRRILLKVPLVLSSTQAQIEEVRDNMRVHLQTSGDFDLSDDAPKYVYVSELGPSSVDLMFYGRTTGPLYADYLGVNERLTLAILRFTSQAGTRLAYPAQTIRMEGDFQVPTDEEQSSQSGL